VVSPAPFPLSVSISIELGGAKSSQGGKLRLRRQLGVVDSSGECCRLLGSFVGFVITFSLSSLCWRNSSMDGCAVIVVLAVSHLPALFLRTVVKSCSTSVYTPYRAPHSYFPSRSWWTVLLVAAIFWTIRFRFGLPPTNAGYIPLGEQWG
jgi:hypothetical protein